MAFQSSVYSLGLDGFGLYSLWPFDTLSDCWWWHPLPTCQCEDLNRAAFLPRCKWNSMPSTWPCLSPTMQDAPLCHWLTQSFPIHVLYRPASRECSQVSPTCVMLPASWVISSLRCDHPRSSRAALTVQDSKIQVLSSLTFADSPFVLSHPMKIWGLQHGVRTTSLVPSAHVSPMDGPSFKGPLLSVRTRQLCLFFSFQMKTHISCEVRLELSFLCVLLAFPHLKIYLANTTLSYLRGELLDDEDNFFFIFFLSWTEQTSSKNIHRSLRELTNERSTVISTDVLLHECRTKSHRQGRGGTKNGPHLLCPWSPLI